MIKLNCKGFMMAEVIIVSTVILSTLVGLYTIFNKMYIVYTERSYYYNVDAVYAGESIYNYFVSSNKLVSILKKDELKAFISFAKIFESLPWRTIKTYKGFKFESIPQIEKPDSIEKDITLSSIRASEKFRLIGYRQEQYFYIVWFDKNHLTYKG